MAVCDLERGHGISREQIRLGFIRTLDQEDFGKASGSHVHLQSHFKRKPLLEHSSKDSKGYQRKCFGRKDDRSIESRAACAFHQRSKRVGASPQ